MMEPFLAGDVKHRRSLWLGHLFSRKPPVDPGVPNRPIRFKLTAETDNPFHGVLHVSLNLITMLIFMAV